MIGRIFEYHMHQKPSFEIEKASQILYWDCYFKKVTSDILLVTVCDQWALFVTQSCSSFPVLSTPYLEAHANRKLRAAKILLGLTCFCRKVSPL